MWLAAMPNLGFGTLSARCPTADGRTCFEMMLGNTPMKGGEITNLKVGDPANTDKPFEVDFDVAVSNYFDWSASDPKLPLPVLGFQLPPPPTKTTARTPSPSSWAAPTKSSMEVKLAIPTKYGVRLPIGVDVKRDYAEYHSSYKFDAGQLAATSQDARLSMAEIPYERREDYAAFRRTVEADQAQNISPRQQVAGHRRFGGRPIARRPFRVGVQAANNNNFTLAIELFERVAKEDPKHKGLWNNLGRAYLADNQYQKAADAFKKQIEANAYDEYAHVFLGSRMKACSATTKPLRSIRRRLR